VKSEKSLTKKRKFRRGIYILPTMFSIASIFCGFYAIILSIRGKLGFVGPLIIIAFILDGLDGRVARLTKTSTEFGTEFDSLADIISFGVAPAVMAYSWSLHHLGRLGLLACFVFTICGAIRLARFNIQCKIVDKRYFVGLPIPASAVVIATIIFFHPNQIADKWFVIFFACIVYLLSFLMVSKIRYKSFKDINFKDRKSYSYILLLLLIFWLIAFKPKIALLVVAASYASSGLLVKFYYLIIRKKYHTTEKIYVSEEKQP
jgi:CDP-diacylglycerol--serine O-phosphatidyltransferase